MKWVYGLVDMQSFYASCEVASLPDYAALRTEEDDFTDPPLVVAGDPERRSGIILAATPPAKMCGVKTAMRLGEALRICPKLIVVRPRMQMYLETSVRIQETIQSRFPLHEQYSVDEAFFAFPYPSHLFPDPVEAAKDLKHTLWDLFRIRSRVGLADNKWMAKMTNKQAKKHPDGVVWWTEVEIQDKLHSLSVFDMWGLKRRAEVLHDKFGAETIGDVAKIPELKLREQFGVWGEVIHRWSIGQDLSPINPNSYDAPHKGFSHRTTLPQDFTKRDEVTVVILELLDEVCRRVRASGQQGRRIGLGLTYAHFEGGFYKAKTLDMFSSEAHELYPFLVHLLDHRWHGEGVRAVSVSLDMLAPASGVQLSLFQPTQKRNLMSKTVDEIRNRYGETSVMRAVSLLPAGQLLDRSQKIGGHYM